AAPPTSPGSTGVDEQIRVELQNIFLDLLSSAQKLSYELATLEAKSSYTAEELKDLLSAAREVVSNVKKMHRFLEKHSKRR
ncbi:MAG: hypothetical protein ACP5KA_07350, partial [Desulfurococcaceae archaeon]